MRTSSEGAGRPKDLLEACVDAALEYVAQLQNRQKKKNVRQAMREALEKVMTEQPFQELRRRSRLKVTGSENVRIRDHVKSEVRTRLKKVGSKVRHLSKRPPVVKTVDKVLFTFGVAWVACTEYVLLEMPEKMAVWGLSTVGPLFLHRVITYRKAGWIYFCLDFCYFVNLLCVFCVLSGRDNAKEPLFHVAFCLCNGPLVFAVVVWRNSFIFHSIDHVCSTMLHALPPLWTFTVRWAEKDQDNGFRIPWTYGLALMTYGIWQVLYLLKTEWLDRDYIRNSPSEYTSLRWLIKDSRGAMYRLCKSFLVSWKLMRPDEEFDESTWRTKLTFWSAQLAYTVITVTPVVFMWRNQRCHLACLLAMYITAIYNGASYYIEVFSRRYNLKFDGALEDSQPPCDDDDDDLVYLHDDEDDDLDERDSEDVQQQQSPVPEEDDDDYHHLDTTTTTPKQD